MSSEQQVERTIWGQEQIEQLKTLLKENKSSDEICQYFNCKAGYLKYKIGDLAFELSKTETPRDEILTLCRLTDEIFDKIVYRQQRKSERRNTDRPTRTFDRSERRTFDRSERPTRTFDRSERRSERTFERTERRPRVELSDRDAEIIRQLNGLKRLILDSYQQQ